MRPSEIRHRSISRTDSQQHDVFISFHRNDSTRASQLARELKERDIRVWLDTLNLAPGDLWQTEIAEALARANAIAVLIGPSGLGGWQELELQMAVAKQPERKLRILPIPLPGAPRSLTLPDLLAPFMHCDLRATHRAQQIDRLADVLLSDRERRDTTSVEPVPSWLSTLFRVAGKSLLRPGPSAEESSAASAQPWPSEESAQIERLPAAAPPPTANPLDITGQEVDELLQDLEPA